MMPTIYVTDKYSNCSDTCKFEEDEKYNEYLYNYVTEYQITEEIKKMEAFRIKFTELINAISQFKCFVHSYRDGHGRSAKEIRENIEIEPSIIEKYNLRQYIHDEFDTSNNFSSGITQKYIYNDLSARIKWINKHDITTNIIEMVYKVYVHRKQLEREIKDLTIKSGCNLKENLNDIFIEINKKIELLYEKYASIMRI